MNILLVEPDYRSKFPPLGLMRISSFHKGNGDSVTFTRGKVQKLRDVSWNRIYVSSLFTYELPRTVRTIKYYLRSVDNVKNIYIGGIGATLLPNYIRGFVKCRVIEGALDKPNMLGKGTPRIDKYIPDYSIIESCQWEYQPEDSYFCRVTVGCIRKCKFCAVSTLEPKFGYLKRLRSQIEEVREHFGEKHNLVIMDNNILASDRIEKVVADIRDEGFEAGATRNRRKRTVDFNQGIDARLIDKKVARLLATINVFPIRLAFDTDGVKDAYIKALRLLAEVGFTQFTTYIMFNYHDTPQSFYNRLKLNTELSKELDIRVSGFPMKYIPIHDVHRRYMANSWHWRYFRGIQCILLATHGIVSPNSNFFKAAFGESYQDFIEVICMPDRYIIYREGYKYDGARGWKKLFNKLSENERENFLQTLSVIRSAKNPQSEINRFKKYRSLLEHYYPNGRIPNVGREDKL
jgi:hypothetical protein